MNPQKLRSSVDSSGRHHGNGDSRVSVTTRVMYSDRRMSSGSKPVSRNRRARGLIAGNANRR